MRFGVASLEEDQGLGRVQNLERTLAREKYLYEENHRHGDSHHGAESGFESGRLEGTMASETPQNLVRSLPGSTDLPSCQQSGGWDLRR